MSKIQTRIAEMQAVAQARNLTPWKLAQISGLSANALLNFYDPNWSGNTRTAIAVERALFADGGTQ